MNMAVGQQSTQRKTRPLVKTWGSVTNVFSVLQEKIGQAQKHREVSDEDRGVRKIMAGTFNSGY